MHIADFGGELQLPWNLKPLYLKFLVLSDQVTYIIMLCVQLVTQYFKTMNPLTAKNTNDSLGSHAHLYTNNVCKMKWDRREDKPCCMYLMYCCIPVWLKWCLVEKYSQACISSHYWVMLVWVSQSVNQLVEILLHFFRSIQYHTEGIIGPWLLSWYQPRCCVLWGWLVSGWYLVMESKFPWSILYDIIEIWKLQIKVMVWYLSGQHV